MKAPEDQNLSLGESVADPINTKLAHVARLEADNLRLRGVLRDLVEALPKCGQCEQPATRAFGRGGERFCDLHGMMAPDYPRAAPLRAALEALKS